MKIQPVSKTNYVTKTNLNNHTGKIYQTNSKDNISFKSYDKLLRNVVSEEIKNGIYVKCNFEELYKTLKDDPTTIKTSYLSILERYDEFKTDIWKFLNIICKPIADVPADLRNIVFEAEKRNIPLITKGEYNTPFMLIHDGKHGFMGNFFNSQNARNNMKFVFSSGDKQYEVGLTKDKWLWAKQEDSDGYKEGIYGQLSCRSLKSQVYIDFSGFPPV